MRIVWRIYCPNSIPSQLGPVEKFNSMCHVANDAELKRADDMDLNLSMHILSMEEPTIKDALLECLKCSSDLIFARNMDELKEIVERFPEIKKSFVVWNFAELQGDNLKWCCRWCKNYSLPLTVPIIGQTVNPFMLVSYPVENDSDEIQIQAVPFNETLKIGNQVFCRHRKTCRHNTE
ncbi:uncharacterized protein LOC132205765 [Neocloeon triangulifer]|uniref:uncharacterized protein LOC132205765 n=1 Tax=Neocloeon triangulifer TaxID=2078957 RepID=UPI00286EC848|nr:uncharacterized protein LOC132205765 [Neocloeon triangulifer]